MKDVILDQLFKRMKVAIDTIAASAGDSDSYDVNEVFQKFRKTLVRSDFIKEVCQDIQYDLFFNKYDGIDLVLEPQKLTISTTAFSPQFDLTSIQAAANAGDRDSQFALAEWYIFKQENYRKAFELYEQAALKQHPKATTKIGGCYWLGRGVKKNAKLAITHFEKAATEGCSDALYYLSKIYYHGLGGVVADFSRTTDYLQRIVDIDQKPNALRLLAQCYYLGHGVEEDKKKSIDLYAKGAMLGDEISRYNAGVISLQFSNSLQHLLDAFEFFSQSANNNHPPAMRALGLLYSKSLVATEEAALMWLGKAGEQKDVIAQFYFSIESIAKGGDIQTYEAGLTTAAQNNIFFAQFLVYIIAEIKKDQSAMSFWLDKLVLHPIERYKSPFMWQITFFMMNLLLFENRTKQQKKIGIQLAQYLSHNNIRMGSLLLANFYARGYIFKKNEIESSRYGKQYANTKKIERFLNLASIAEKFDRGPLITILKQAAELNSEVAHFQLGQILLKLNQVQESYVHFKQVADMDHTQSCRRLLIAAACYELGKLLTQRTDIASISDVPYKEQGKYYLKLAEQLGHFEAVSFYYQHLLENEKDRNIVLVEIRQKAMTGDSSAMFNLAKLCMQEQECNVIGLFWLKKAAYLGHPIAQEQLKNSPQPSVNLSELFELKSLAEELECWKKLAKQSHDGAIAVLTSVGDSVPIISSVYAKKSGNTELQNFYFDLMQIIATKDVGQNDILFLDLHGLSVESAKASVERCIINGYRDGKKSVRIVTGRGNHINRTGRRGALYEECEHWLSQEEIKNKLANITKKDGYYLVIFKKGAEEVDAFGKETLDYYAKNLPELEKKAKGGDADALFQVANAYWWGLGGYKQDEKKANSYFLKAAEREHPLAQEHIARCYSLGQGIRQDDKKALYWYEKAANNGCPNSQFMEGMFHLNGWSVPVNFAKAVECFQIAAANGFPQAMRRLAGFYAFGEVVPKNVALAFEWYKKASAAGDPYSSYNLGCYYENGIAMPITPETLKLAFQAYLLSAEGKDADGARAVGRCYLNGIGIKQDLDKAKEWLLQAIEWGQIEAYSELAKLHLILNDTNEAEELLRKGATLGGIFPQFNLLISQFTRGKDEWFYWFDKISEHPISELAKLPEEFQLSVGYSLAVIMDDDASKEVQTKKNKKGIKLLSQLGESGYARAYPILAEAYAYENKLTQSFQSWNRGAKLGNDDCLFGVAECYRKGIGVPVNEDKAKEFYQRAADKRNPEALFYLTPDEINEPSHDPEVLVKKSNYFKEIVTIIEQRTQTNPTTFYALSAWHDRRHRILLSATYTVAYALARLAFYTLGPNMERSIAAAKESHIFFKKITNSKYKEIPPEMKSRAEKEIESLEGFLIGIGEMKETDSSCSSSSSSFFYHRQGEIDQKVEEEIFCPQETEQKAAEGAGCQIQ